MKMRAFPSSSPSFLLGSLLISAILPVTAEIREFDLMLPPTEAYIHYTDGYLRAPGYIDITSLTFEAVGEAFSVLGDDFVGTDDGFTPTGDDTTGGGGNRRTEKEEGSHRRHLNRHRNLFARWFFPEAATTTRSAASISATRNDGTKPATRRLDGGIETEAFAVDVAVFSQPDRCAKKKDGCDWTELGVGAKTDDGTLRWCCSEDAVDFGMCDEANLGRLILKEGVFTGDHRFINVPYSGEMKKQLKYGKFDEKESGRYVVVFSNCDGDGRDIRVTGHSIWKSTHGYLPGELFGFMYFYAILTIIYAVLVVWYGGLMRLNKDSRIPIEKWIFITIIMGLSEMFFRSSDYFIWNTSGNRPMAFVYLGIIVGVLKRGISRVLMVMVSLGWGVIRDSLGSTMNSIVVLGAAYIGVSAFRDLMMIFAEEDMTTLSYDREVVLFDIVTILTFVVAAIDVIFILWILDALNGTMQYLENMSQVRKLKRYLSLRSILLFAILFATIWVVFSLVDNYDEDGIVREEHEWIVDAATEVNYLYVLIGIACLWRPNPSAREYAYVMELPASGGGEDGETELELSGVVPSAMDDDEVADPPSNGHKPANGGADTRFKIDEGEVA